MRNSWMFVLQRYVKKCFPKTVDKRTRHIFQIGGQVHSTLHLRSFPNGALFFKGRLLTSSWHTLKNSLLFWSFFQKSKQTVEVTLVLALRKVWCEKLLQSSSFIYRKKRRVKNRTKQGDESILYSLHIFFKDILQLKSKCLFFYVSSFAFRFTFLSNHRWWLLKYLKAI